MLQGTRSKVTFVLVGDWMVLILVKSKRAGTLEPDGFRQEKQWRLGELEASRARGSYTKGW